MVRIGSLSKFLSLRESNQGPAFGRDSFINTNMKNTISLRLDAETKKKLQEIADAQNRSFSNLVETILQESLKKYEAGNLSLK